MLLDAWFKARMPFAFPEHTNSAGENDKSEAVIENDPAKDLLKQSSVLRFLDKYLAEGPTHKNALNRLKTARKNLCAEKVILALRLRPENEQTFNDIEWY